MRKSEKSRDLNIFLINLTNAIAKVLKFICVERKTLYSGLGSMRLTEYFPTDSKNRRKDFVNTGDCYFVTNNGHFIDLHDFHFFLLFPLHIDVLVSIQHY